VITLNTFSVIDLLAVIVSLHVLLVFLYRSLRETRRRIDLLFTAMMALVTLGSVFVLVADNIVPQGTPASAVPDAAARTLFWYRLMYVSGTVFMAAITHFALRFNQSTRLPGARVAWLYAGALAIVPLYFTDGFLAARAVPLSETSGWWCAVPWQPESGPWTLVFLLLWIAVNVHVHWLFWRRRQRSGASGGLDLRNFVWAGIALWGLGGLQSIVLAALGYAGVDPSMLMVTAAMVVLAVGLAEDFHRSEVQRRHVTRRFESYVDPALVKYVIENPQTEHIAGEVRELTVVFTDLEGFTALTERLREGAVSLLNEYLRLMVPLIRSHNGYRNKFLGDGMMFFYGAPEQNPDHAIHAVATVLKMQETMVTFNALIAGRREEFGDALPQLAMRTGVSSGQMIVGDAGPEEASDYTVLGDTVNLGARLESANKQLGTRILLSERTVELIPSNLFLLRPVGRIQVAGLKRAVLTYEPLAHLDQATARQKAGAALQTRLVESFHAADFRRCLEFVAEAEREFGPGKLTDLYRSLSERYLQSPPGSEFAGQIVLTEK
jgi:class 3 adenylate cyclase